MHYGPSEVPYFEHNYAAKRSLRHRELYKVGFKSARTETHANPGILLKEDGKHQADEADF